MFHQKCHDNSMRVLEHNLKVAGLLKEGLARCVSRSRSQYGRSPGFQECCQHSDSEIKTAVREGTGKNGEERHPNLRRSEFLEKPAHRACLIANERPLWKERA